MIKYLLYNIIKLKKLKKKILFTSEKKFHEMIEGQKKFFTGLSLLSIFLNIQNRGKNIIRIYNYIYIII